VLKNTKTFSDWQNISFLWVIGVADWNSDSRTVTGNWAIAISAQAP